MADVGNDYISVNDSRLTTFTRFSSLKHIHKFAYLRIIQMSLIDLQADAKAGEFVRTLYAGKTVLQCNIQFPWC